MSPIAMDPNGSKLVKLDAMGSNGYNWVQMDPNGSNWVQMGTNRCKFVQTGPNWFLKKSQNVEIGPTLLEQAQTGPNWSEHVHPGQNRSKIVLNVPKCPNMVHNCFNIFKIIPKKKFDNCPEWFTTRPKCSKIVQNSLIWYNMF